MAIPVVEDLEGVVGRQTAQWPADQKPQNFVDPALLFSRANHRLIPVVSTPPGSDPTFPRVPSRNVWEEIFIRGTLTASAAAATRVPNIFFEDPNTTQFYGWVPSVTTTAGQANVYTGPHPAIGLASGSQFQWLGYREVRLLPQYRLRIVTANIDTGDQWSAVALYVRQSELPEGVS